MIKANENQIGVSKLDFIPTDDNVLLKGTAKNSTLGIINTKYDEGEIFIFEVVGFGKTVNDLQLGDVVKLLPGSEGRIDIPENSKSFERIRKYLKSLKNKEFEDYNFANPKTNFEEYFLVKRYAVLGIFTSDKTRNAFYNE